MFKMKKFIYKPGPFGSGEGKVYVWNSGGGGWEWGGSEIKKLVWGKGRQGKRDLQRNFLKVSDAVKIVLSLQ